MANSKKRSFRERWTEAGQAIKSPVKRPVSNSNGLSPRQVTVRSIGWCCWLVAAWLIATFLVTLPVAVVMEMTKRNPLDNTLISATTQAVLEVAMALFVVGVPYLWSRGRKRKLTASGRGRDLLQESADYRRAERKRERREARLELADTVGWRPTKTFGDWLKSAAPKLLLGVVLYYATALLVSFVAYGLFGPTVMNQDQDLGLPKTGNSWWQIVIIMILLVVVAPLAEETIFRGWLFNKLRPMMAFWSVAIIVSMLFALAHGQINVGITTFVLSMYACWLREQTGSIWAGVGLHAITNLVAATLIFIVPLF